MTSVEPLIVDLSLFADPGTIGVVFHSADGSPITSCAPTTPHGEIVTCDNTSVAMVSVVQSSSFGPAVMTVFDVGLGDRVQALTFSREEEEYSVEVSIPAYANTESYRLSSGDDCGYSSGSAGIRTLDADDGCLDINGNITALATAVGAQNNPVAYATAAGIDTDTTSVVPLGSWIAPTGDIAINTS
ncbi:MAG: hypothetical protein KC561_17400, partial [Myxococcales bacterium]|nr:hypothetical protein [Myxococcales bacterium]